MKLTVTWIFVVIWFLYLATGAGAGFSCWRIWPMRRDRFASRLILALHAMMVDALLAIVLVFLGKGVKFTWKFSIAIFVAATIKMAVSLPLLLMLMRGLEDQKGATPGMEHDDKDKTKPNTPPEKPETPGGPPVKPRDGEDPPPDFGVPVGPGKGG